MSYVYALIYKWKVYGYRYKPGSYTISVYNSNDTYLIKKKDRIKRSFAYLFLNHEGTINNEQFSGQTAEGYQFQLEQTNTTTNQERKKII